MNSQLPTRESFLLACKLGHNLSFPEHLTRAEVTELTDEALYLSNTMLSVEIYVKLVAILHDTLHHQPQLCRGCHAQLEFLSAALSQFFALGWRAGQQEIIDKEVERMEAKP